ncbi:hypothetical protein Dsin_015943 [Dipteronia sinensis]|uniref:Zinc knuckle CX2CX4HX4C domain-containing protein n=1 Tax=Dipteronia sinensis TaxID=43782 RepID=A0AAE0E591_9ROSI|nr:hypothetical protein Dsin_015943 [Dipteronia sinensis]
MKVIGKFWRVKEGFEIEAVTGNVFTFHFKTEDDHRRVISGCPWSFDNALMVPILCMTKKMGWFLGSMIGEVVEVDGGNAGEAGGKFMRVRVRIEIDKPLKMCLQIDILGDGVKTIMLLRYERLPNHCFKCGMVDHCRYECPSTVQSQVSNGVEIMLFGIWMRASTSFSKNKDKKRAMASFSKDLQRSTVAGEKGGSNQYMKSSANEEGSSTSTALLER